MIANKGLNVQFAGNINIAYIYFLKTLYSVKAELIVLKPVTDNFILRLLYVKLENCISR